jgi:rhomboid family GlyGly-CTERM serine protease
MPTEQDSRAPSPVLPTATLVIGLAAVMVFLFPATSAPLIYERSLILHGEIWRVWTGHLVHFSKSHLFWDLAVYVVAGCWLERLRPRAARWFYVVCPPLIAAALLVCDPSLERYAGLSGVATGLLVFLACLQLGESRTEPRWFWLAVLALVALKIGLEAVTHTHLLVGNLAGVRVVPLAHVSGAVCGFAFWAMSVRR